jgi:hypothetical protein
VVGLAVLERISGLEKLELIPLHAAGDAAFSAHRVYEMAREILNGDAENVLAP